MTLLEYAKQEIERFGLTSRIQAYPVEHHSGGAKEYVLLDSPYSSGVYVETPGEVVTFLTMRFPSRLEEIVNRDQSTTLPLGYTTRQVMYGILHDAGIHPRHFTTVFLYPKGGRGLTGTEDLKAFERFLFWGRQRYYEKDFKKISFDFATKVHTWLAEDYAFPLESVGKIWAQFDADGYFLTLEDKEYPLRCRQVDEVLENPALLHHPIFKSGFLSDSEMQRLLDALKKHKGSSVQTALRLLAEEHEDYRGLAT